MHPFFPSHPNQVQIRGGNSLAPQQVVLPNPHQSQCSSCPQHNPLGFNNSHQVPSQSHAPSHRFQTPSVTTLENQNPHLNSLHGNNMAVPNWTHLMPSPCFPSGPHLVQNGHLGMNQLQGHPPPQNLNQIAALTLHGQFCNAPQNLYQISAPQLHGQFSLLGQPPNLNQVGHQQPGGQFRPQNLPQNMNQFMGLPHGQFCSQNLMLPVNQFVPQQWLQQPLGSTQVGPFNNPPSSHPMVVGSGAANSHMCLGNSNQNSNNPLLATQSKNQDHCMFTEPTTVGQNAVQESIVAAQNSRSSFTAGRTQTHQSQKNIQSFRYQQPQVNHIEDGKRDNSNYSSGNPKNLPRNRHGFGKREQSHTRFQKPQFHHVRNAKGNFRPFAKNLGKGQQNGRERNPQLAKFGKQAQGKCQRPLYLKYTKEEIQQWREARKKNFPTTATIEKKLAGIDGNGDAKIRRQQLKDILAKQAELGVEVAELPPNYLSEPEVQNKFNKRGRHGRGKLHAKKQKSGNGTPAVHVPIKREPTLLQKLLSADIKRDKNRLLQIFRFMTLNSFFDHWPDKPLEFPLVTAKNLGYEDESARDTSLHDAAFVDGKSFMVEVVEGKKKSSVVDEAQAVRSDSDNGESDNEREEEADCDSIRKQDYVREQTAEKLEEGEITE